MLCSKFTFGIILPFNRYQDYNFQFKTNKIMGGYNSNIELTEDKSNLGYEESVAYKLRVCSWVRRNFDQSEREKIWSPNVGNYSQQWVKLLTLPSLQLCTRTLSKWCGTVTCWWCATSVTLRTTRSPWWRAGSWSQKRRTTQRSPTAASSPSFRPGPSLLVSSCLIQ